MEVDEKTLIKLLDSAKTPYTEWPEMGYREYHLPVQPGDTSFRQVRLPIPQGHAPSTT